MALELKKTKAMEARRIVVYGQRGRGKSTFASLMPNPVFIDAEGGLSSIDATAFQRVAQYKDLIAQLTQLLTEEHEYATCVIDGMDSVETIIHRHVCATVTDNGKRYDNITAFGWNRGQQYALKFHCEVRDLLERLRTERGMWIVLVGHEEVATVVDPEDGKEATYQYHDLKMFSGKNCSSRDLWEDWADEVFYATFDKITDPKKTRSEVRNYVMITSQQPGVMAKRRLPLPDSMPNDPSVYLSYVQNFYDPPKNA